MKLTAVEPISVVVGDAGHHPVGSCTYLRYCYWKLECLVCHWAAEGETSPELAIARLLAHLRRQHG